MMNSTQQSMRRSRASFANETPPDEWRISVMIFCTVALGRERSSAPFAMVKNVVSKLLGTEREVFGSQRSSVCS